MLELPPSGTRGAEVPKAVRSLMKSMGWAGKLMQRFGVKIQGRPVMRLITSGARSRKRRETVLGGFRQRLGPSHGSSSPPTAAPPDIRPGLTT